MPDKQGLPQCVADKLVELDRARVSLLGLVETVRKLEKIAKAYKGRAFVALPNRGRVALYVDVDDLLEVVPVLRDICAEFGPSGGPKDNEGAFRQWAWATVDLLVIPVGSTCTWVEVGKKEVPILELHCEGVPA